MLGPLPSPPKDIVRNDFPRHNNKLAEEQGVNGNLQTLFQSADNSFAVNRLSDEELTRINKHLIAPFRMSRTTVRMSPERREAVNSSSSKGIINAPAKGQPRMAPTPNHMIPSAVFCFPCPSKNAESPSMEVYMAKLDGRKAAEAWKKPGLNTTIIKNRSPIRGLSFRQMAEYRRVSHAAQMKANAKRIV